MSSKRKEAMAVVLKREGFEGDLMGFLDEFAMESVVPGICLDCHYEAPPAFRASNTFLTYSFLKLMISSI